MMKRRTFVEKGALGISAWGVAAAGNHALGQSKAKKKLGLAIVGLGGYAESSIVPELPFCQHVELRGVVTGDRAKGESYAEKHGFSKKSVFDYSEYEKLADHPEIDFVHIVLPNKMHAEYTIRAAKAGKHVMCEKPMATTVKDGKAMIKACQEAGVKLGVNYRLHWEPHHQKMMQFAKEEKYGPISNGNAEFSWGYTGGLSHPERSKTIKRWLLDKEMAGGGALYDTGVYPIQAACYSTGAKPVWVSGLASTIREDLYPEGIEETMSYTLGFESGFVMQCRASYAYNGHQYSLMGAKGDMHVLPDTRDGKRGSVFGQSGVGKPSYKRIVARAGRDEVDLENILQQQVLLDAFAESIQKRSDFRTPGEMGLRDLQIMEAVQQSADAGGERMLVNYS